MKLPAALAIYFDELNEKREQQCLLMLAGDFSYEGVFDLITDCFLNNDPVLFESAIPWLKQAMQKKSFMDKILRFERNRLGRELEQLHTCDLHHHHIKKTLDEISTKTLREQALHMFDDLCSTMPAAKEFTVAQCRENYYFTKLLCVVYEAHCAERREQNRFKRTLPEATLLYQYYLAADIDLLKEDSQYSKYKLYSISEEIQLLIGMPCRIFDPKQPLQIFVEDIPRHVLELFERLRKDGLIKDLALLASNEALVKTDKHIFITLGIEDIQLPLTLHNLSRQPDEELIHTVMQRSNLPIDGVTLIPSVSTFCELYSEDRTWCSITMNSMTFEEVAHIPELLEDCAVTKVIHLEYFVNRGQLYVSHIDHEYIFYTHEEYDLRAKDPFQKGSARKRLKTFKIDHSSIPFILEDGTLFVHTLIEACFSRPHLLMNFLTDMLPRTPDLRD